MSSSGGTLTVGAEQGAGLTRGRHGRAPEKAAKAGSSRGSRIVLRTIALGYLAVLLGAPLAMIFYRTFEHGLAPVWDAVTAPNALHAMWLSLEIVLIVVPLNTVFGIGAAILLERGRMPAKTLFGLLIDMPFAISPIVVGLALVLVYGRVGWFGNELAAQGINIIFSVPGMVMATLLVTLPFVVRETIPVLREMGTDSEQAAETLGREPLADLLADHPARHPLGRRLRRRADDSSRARRVRRGQHRLRAHRGPDPDAAALRAGPLRELRHDRRLHGSRDARPAGAVDAAGDEPARAASQQEGRPLMAIQVRDVNKQLRRVPGARATSASTSPTAR